MLMRLFIISQVLVLAHPHVNLDIGTLKLHYKSKSWKKYRKLMNQALRHALVPIAQNEYPGSSNIA